MDGATGTTNSKNVNYHWCLFNEAFSHHPFYCCVNAESDPSGLSLLMDLRQNCIIRFYFHCPNKLLSVCVAFALCSLIFFYITLEI